MKGKIRRIACLVGLLLILAGLCVGGYPIVSNWYCEYQAGKEIRNYQEALKDQDEEEIATEWEQAQTYNQMLNSDQGVSKASYNDMLAVTDAIGYLEIPKLNLYLPIYHGTEESSLEKGVGHMEGTSLPVGGSSTHCVLSGHTGLPTAKLFTHLDELEEGDQFYIHVLEETLAYQVDQTKIVLPEETDDIQIVPGKDYVTLLTCIPYGVNSHRLLVRGERIAYEPEQIAVEASTEENPEAAVSENTIYNKKEILLLAGAVLLLILAMIVIVYRKRKK